MSIEMNTLTQLIKAALTEDVGPGDITSLASLEPNPFMGQVIAKSDGIISGLEAFAHTFEIVDSANNLKFLLNDGDSFKSGDLIIEIDGFNQSVLTAERIALNFLGRLSGVATLTGQYVKEINNSSVQIIDTRKTTPGWRMLEKKAVVHGGGHNHRFGLYDMILIKDNHIASTGSISGAINNCKEFLSTPDFRIQFKKTMEEIIIEVEVENEAQLKEAITSGADRLLLDNQSIESLKKLVTVARDMNSAVKLEASGNVSLANVKAISKTGVDYISIGAITHSAPSSDFSLKAK